MLFLPIGYRMMFVFGRHIGMPGNGKEDERMHGWLKNKAQTLGWYS